MVNIEFIPNKKQAKAWLYLQDKETDFLGYGGAAYGGKSYLISYWLTTMCIAYPGTRWGLGRKELVRLKKTTLNTLWKVFKLSGIKKDVDYHYDKQLHIITFSNGSEIVLVDMAYQPSDPYFERFGGYEFTGAAVDEAGESTWVAINILYTRCGRCENFKYGLKAKILECFNPTKSHVYSRYYKPWKEKTLKPTYKFIRALPQDNPSPEAAEYIRGIMANSDQTTIERLIKGNFEFDDDPMSLIDEKSIGDLFTNTHVTGINRYITADIARFGKDATEVWVWEGWRVVAVYVYKKQSLVETSKRIREIADKHRIPMSQTLVDEDGVGGGVKDILSCEGFIANSRSYSENYGNLKTECAFMFAKKCTSKEVYISTHPDVEKVKEELRWLKRKDNDSEKTIYLLPKDEIKIALGRSPDSLDNGIMRAYFELYQRRGIVRKN